MRVLIRTDASVDIGSGHAIRCLTLADQLRANGAEVAFLCTELPGAMLELIRARGYLCGQLPPAVVGENVLDADESIRTAAEIMPGISDWMVVDHYQLDARWEKKVRVCSRRVMVIDDIANRPHLCDLLVDQNYEDVERYKRFVSHDCRLLLGPSYALLRPEYAEYRALKTVRTQFIRRVLVFFGGSDHQDLTGTALKALSVPALSGLDVDLVVGANYIHYDSLNQLASIRGKTTIHRPRSHLADLMTSADIAIGAGGVTNWERMCLGLPSLVITLAENQVPISKILHQRGVIRLLGKSEEVTATRISDELLDEIQSGRHVDRIAPAMSLCDGLGVTRVQRAMALFQ